MTLILLTCLISSFSSVLFGQQFEQSSDFYFIGTLESIKPAYLSLMQLTPNSNKLDLVVSSFRFRSDTNGYWVFNNIGDYLLDIQNGNPPQQEYLLPPDQYLTWPNGANMAPDGIFQSEGRTLILHDGFLIPTHQTGGLYALLLDTNGVGQQMKLLYQQDGCYFHNSSFIDLNQDGLLDLLAIMTCQESFGEDEGWLIWLEQPKNDPLNEEWTMQVITIGGPDVWFGTQINSLNSSELIIYAPQFFTKKLCYYILTFGTLDISDCYLIDQDLGKMYDVQLVSLKKDGINQLVITNHETTADITGVFIYDFPNNWDPKNINQLNEFTRTKIAGGFNTSGDASEGAPGIIYIYNLKESELNDPNVDFYISVSGDDNFFAWEIVPQLFNREGNWRYDQYYIQGTVGISGSMAIGDVNNDDWVEVFVPDFERQVIYVWTANPQFSTKFNVTKKFEQKY